MLQFVTAPHVHKAEGPAARLVSVLNTGRGLPYSRSCTKVKISAWQCLRVYFGTLIVSTLILLPHDHTT